MMSRDEEGPMIEYKTVAQFEHERAENFRTAALLGYGALLAHNADDKFKEVLRTLNKMLWSQPDPPVIPQ